MRLCPEASEELRLAARCQHICRWEIPRGTYPMTRAGYLKWRADLKKFHAQKAGEILREAGYDETTIRRVQDLNLKKNFPDDPETRVLEDALCLVFLRIPIRRPRRQNRRGQNHQRPAKILGQNDRGGPRRGAEAGLRPARKSLAPTRPQRLIRLMPQSPDAPPNNQIPLVVDLDGTLIKTDLLWESLARLLRRNPFCAFPGLVLVDARSRPAETPTRRACHN